jgi:hypothetical protein
MSNVTAHAMRISLKWRPLGSSHFSAAHQDNTEKIVDLHSCHIRDKSTCRHEHRWQTNHLLKRQKKEIVVAMVKPNKDSQPSRSGSSSDGHQYRQGRNISSSMPRGDETDPIWVSDEDAGLASSDDAGMTSDDSNTAHKGVRYPRVKVGEEESLGSADVVVMSRVRTAPSVEEASLGSADVVVVDNPRRVVTYKVSKMKPSSVAASTIHEEPILRSPPKVQRKSSVPQGDTPEPKKSPKKVDPPVSILHAPSKGLSKASKAASKAASKDSKKVSKKGKKSEEKPEELERKPLVEESSTPESKVSLLSRFRSRSRSLSRSRSRSRSKGKSLSLKQKEPSLLSLASSTETTKSKKTTNADGKKSQTSNNASPPASPSGQSHSTGSPAHQGGSSLYRVSRKHQSPPRSPKTIYELKKEEDPNLERELEEIALHGGRSALISGKNVDIENGSASTHQSSSRFYEEDDADKSWHGPLPSAPGKQKRRYRIGLGIFALALIASIVLVVCFGLDSKDVAVQEEGTKSSLTIRQQAIHDILARITDEKILNDPKTPQYRARQWLLFRDGENKGAITEDRLVQRYALITFYFSTGGEEAWKENNWLKGNECDGTFWRGLNCNSDGEVRALFFGTFGSEC